jgi:hypothetical protein
MKLFLALIVIAALSEHFHPFLPFLKAPRGALSPLVEALAAHALPPVALLAIDSANFYVSSLPKFLKGAKFTKARLEGIGFGAGECDFVEEARPR